MKGKWIRRGVWTAVALLVLFGAAVVVAPRVKADALRGPLQEALSEALGRKVLVGEVRYTVFPVLGVTATDLVIPEDPRVGLEPVAYVTELQAGVHVSSVWRGRMVVSSLRLVEASINLERTDELGWNVGLLLARAEQRVKEQELAPGIALRRGRINFRQGTRKSPFFLNDVDLDLEAPRSAQEPVEWSFEASPARTDRAEIGFGRFRGDGRWRAAKGVKGGIAEVEIELERSATSEVAILVTGQDLGLQGRMTARVQLNGPPAEMALRGRIELEDLDRGGRFGARGEEWVLPFEGSFHAERQAIEVRTQEGESQEATPLMILLAARGLLTKPEVEAAFTLNAFPAPTFLDIARRLGAETPPGFTLEGTLHGALALPKEGSLNGEVALRDGEVRLEGAGPVSVKEATVRIAGGALELLPATLTTPSGATADVSGRWTAATGALAFQTKFMGLPLDELKTALGTVAAQRPEPLEACGQGVASGELRYEQGPETGAGAWAGEMALKDAECTAPGLRNAAKVRNAAVSLRGAQWAVTQAAVRWAGAEGVVSVMQGPGQLRPVRVTVQAERLDGRQLEEGIRAATERRSTLLQRTLRRALPPPEWLLARRVEVEVRARVLALADEEFERVRLHAFWDGARIDLPRVELARGGAVFSGRGEVNLRAAMPAYQLTGVVERFGATGAVVDATVDLRTAGLGKALLEAMRVSGRLDAWQVATSGGSLDWVAACYDYEAARPQNARLRLQCLEARDGGEWFTGEETAGSLERISVALTGARRALTVTWPAGQ